MNLKYLSREELDDLDDAILDRMEGRDKRLMVNFIHSKEWKKRGRKKL